MFCAFCSPPLILTDDVARVALTPYPPVQQISLGACDSFISTARETLLTSGLFLCLCSGDIVVKVLTTKCVDVYAGAGRLSR